MSYDVLIMLNDGSLTKVIYVNAEEDVHVYIVCFRSPVSFPSFELMSMYSLQIWQFSDSNRAGYLSRQEFYNALKLVTVAQTGRELTPELVKAALNGPAASQIPPPRINAPTPPPNANFGPTPRAPQGNYGHQFSSPGFNAAGSGLAQARPPLGVTSSLPSGAHGTHFSTGMGLSTGSGLQSTPAPGLPRPAPPSSMLSTAASLPSAPAFQARMFCEQSLSALLLFSTLLYFVHILHIAFN